MVFVVSLVGAVWAFCSCWLLVLEFVQAYRGIMSFATYPAGWGSSALGSCVAIFVTVEASCWLWYVWPDCEYSIYTQIDVVYVVSLYCYQHLSGWYFAFISLLGVALAVGVGG